MDPNAQMTNAQPMGGPATGFLPPHLQQPLIPTGGSTPPPMQQVMGAPPPVQTAGGTVGGAERQPLPPAQPQAASAPQVVGLKHRTTGMEYDFNETMAASAEVYPIDANGNEVFNVPGVAGSQTDPRYNQQPTIQGYATTVEMQLLRTEIDRLSQELAQLRMELASVRQQPAYPVAA